LSKLAKGQRRLREARLHLVAVRDACPELRDDVEQAIAATLRAEDRSAEIIREAVGLKRPR